MQGLLSTELPGTPRQGGAFFGNVHLYKGGGASYLLRYSVSASCRRKRASRPRRDVRGLDATPNYVWHDPALRRIRQPIEFAYGSR
mmetsp:Transcript_9024/g.18047  ORF Transcript_9024/g.18047 Transcript_9024/m.18047 type:complete len:86 (-) Transcript_9024:108-365(-)